MEQMHADDFIPEQDEITDEESSSDIEDLYQALKEKQNKKAKIMIPANFDSLS